MITRHTAQSLCKYGGKPVWLTERKHSATLLKWNMKSDFVGVEWEAHNGNDFTEPETRKESILIKNVLPILKDYTQLLVPMMHEGVEIMPIEWVYGWDEKSKINLKANGIEYEKYENIFEIVFDDFINTVKNDLFVFDRIQKLQALGFGAIKCDESPTGYRDLWNNPCALDEGK